MPVNHLYDKIWGNIQINRSQETMRSSSLVEAQPQLILPMTKFEEENDDSNFLLLEFLFWKKESALKRKDIQPPAKRNKLHIARFC